MVWGRTLVGNWNDFLGSCERHCSLLYIFINLLDKDKGNKEWWKVEAKEKEKRNPRKPKVLGGGIISDKGRILLEGEREGK